MKYYYNMLNRLRRGCAAAMEKKCSKEKERRLDQQLVQVINKMADRKQSASQRSQLADNSVNVEEVEQELELYTKAWTIKESMVEEEYSYPTKTRRRSISLHTERKPVQNQNTEELYQEIIASSRNVSQRVGNFKNKSQPKQQQKVFFQPYTSPAEQVRKLQKVNS